MYIMSLVSISKVVDYEYSPFFLRDSRANETQARVKVTSREKGETRRGERRMRDCSYSTKVVVSRIEEEAISLSILILLLSSLWLTSSLFQLQPIFISVCPHFMSYVAVLRPCRLSQFNPNRASIGRTIAFYPNRPGSNPGSEAKHGNMSSLLVDIVVVRTCLLPSHS